MENILYETKTQKLVDKNIFERQVKLQADSGRIRGTRDSYSRPHVCFNMTMAL